MRPFKKGIPERSPQHTLHDRTRHIEEAKGAPTAWGCGRTAQVKSAWAELFIRFHGIQYPDTMAEPEVNAFLAHLAVDRDLAPSSQNQAMAALLFLYDAVLRGRSTGSRA